MSWADRIHRAQRRAKVAVLAAQELTAVEIAPRIGNNDEDGYRIVLSDLKAIERDFRAAALDERVRLKGMLLNRLLHTRQEASDAWERS